VRARTGEPESPAERLERRLHPISAGFVVPLFALSAAGITIAAVPQAVTDPIAQGVFAGLLFGKTIGILGGAWLAVRLRFGRLPDGVRWGDVVPVAVLGGIGYTVSLLVTELAFTAAEARQQTAVAVLGASLCASAVALALLRRRTRVTYPASDPGAHPA
jgi:NhaA family Na+:H+ antiporter